MIKHSNKTLQLKGWFTLKTTFFYYTGPPHYNTIKAIIIFLMLYIPLYSIFTRGIQVASPAGVGVPNMSVIDVLPKNEPPPSRKPRHDWRKEPNGNAHVQYSADSPFAPFANRDTVYATGGARFWAKRQSSACEERPLPRDTQPGCTGEYAVLRYVQHEKNNKSLNRIVMWGGSGIRKCSFSGEPPL